MPTQTPASRKFAPPPSTSSARALNSHSFSSRFIRPSQTSSSPFSRTPFSSTAYNQRKDEIEAEDSASDAETTEPDSHSRYREPKAFQSERLHQKESDVASDFEIDDETHQHMLSPSIDRSTEQHKELAPSPTAVKRRKTFHVVSNLTGEGGLDSSPPLNLLLASNQLEDSQYDQVQTSHSPSREATADQSTSAAPLDPREHRDNSSEDSSSSHNSPAKEIVTPKHRNSRFLHPPHSSTPFRLGQNHLEELQQYPSFQSRLLASAASTFRGPQPSFDSTLPDAFSPSRRKGQKEYLHGGNAETVRSWVLEIAARAGGPGRAHNQAFERPTRVDQKELTIHDVLLKDRDGRFALARASTAGAGQVSDEEPSGQESGRTWMLINADAQTVGHSSVAPISKLDQLRVGTQVLVKGPDFMTWCLDVDRQYHVAVLWDIS